MESEAEYKEWADARESNEEAEEVRANGCTCFAMPRPCCGVDLDRLWAFIVGPFA